MVSIQGVYKPVGSTVPLFRKGLNIYQRVFCPAQTQNPGALVCFLRGSPKASSREPSALWESRAHPLHNPLGLLRDPDFL